MSNIEEEINDSEGDSSFSDSPILDEDNLLDICDELEKTDIQGEIKNVLKNYLECMENFRNTQKEIGDNLDIVSIETKNEKTLRDELEDLIKQLPKIMENDMLLKNERKENIYKIMEEIRTKSTRRYMSGLNRFNIYVKIYHMTDDILPEPKILDTSKLNQECEVLLKKIFDKNLINSINNNNREIRNKMISEIKTLSKTWLFIPDYSFL